MSDDTTVDVFSLAPPATFRGIEFPVMDLGWEHSHNTVEHGIQYKQGRIIEITGARNLEFTYTIPFRQGIAKGNYSNLFMQTLPEFWEAYLNKEVGTLIDPLLGVFDVVPVKWSATGDVKRRDGIDVRVTFLRQLLAEEDVTVFRTDTLEGVTDEAAALDAELDRMDWEQEESPEPTTDPLSAIAGLGAQINAAPARVNAALHNTAHRCEKVEKQLAKLKDPQTAAAPTQGARRVRLSCLRLAEENANPARTAKQVTLSQATALSAIAAEHGNAVEDLILLNPGIEGTPLVPAETVITYYE